MRAEQRTDRRFPRRVYGVGAEPDPRFSLANERTFLAWIRTSMALVVAGVAVEALAPGIEPGLRLVCAVLLVSGGVLASVQAWVGWVATERALREQRPLPSSRLSPVLAVGVLVTGVLVVVGLALG